MRKNIVQPDGPQMSVGYNMVHALYMPDKYGKATDTQSEYLIIIAFREQK
jgi:hypothetical protein